MKQTGQSGDMWEARTRYHRPQARHLLGVLAHGRMGQETIRKLLHAFSDVIMH